MQEIIAYCCNNFTHRKLKDVIQKKDSGILILALLSLNPVFTNLVSGSIHINCESYAHLLWCDKFLQQRLDIRSMILEEITTYRPNLAPLANLINSFSEAPVKNVQSIMDFMSLKIKQNDSIVVSFYSILISAYCHMKGIGVPKDPEKALVFLENAIKIVEDYNEVTLDVTLALNYLASNFTLDRYEVCELYGRALLIQARASLWEPSKDYIEKHHALLSLESLYGSKLRTLSEAINKLSANIKGYAEKKAKLTIYHSEIFRKYLKCKLAIYTYHINSRHSADINARYLEIYNDKDLINPPINSGEYFDALLKFSDSLDKAQKSIWATKFYLLHFSLTSSPESAMRLADMAANGFLRTEESAPMISNFVSSAEYYNKAIDEAIKECDLAAAARAIQAYKKIEKWVDKNKHIDLSAKLQKAIAALKDVAGKKDQALTFRIEHVKNRNKIKHIEDVMVESLLEIILQNSFSRDYLQEVKKFHFTRNPHGFDAWFKMVARNITPDVDQTGPTQNEILLTEYKEMLPRITAELELSEGKDPASLGELVSCITRHKLDLILSPSNDQFFAVFNGLIVKIIHDTVVHNDENRFTSLCSIFNSTLPPQLTNRYSQDLTFWSTRMRFESYFKSNAEVNVIPSDLLSEIYKFSYYEKNGVKPFFSSILSSISYIRQLKLKEHPEASLKVAQLIAAKLTSASLDTAFIDIGSHVIKAMTSFIPDDNLGIYATLAFRLINGLEIKLREEGYSDSQRSLVHFYYALALLIRHPELFYGNLTNFFESKSCSVTAKSALELLKNPKLFFSHEVKRYLLNQIVGLEKLVTPEMIMEANAMLKQLPAVTPASAPAAVVVSPEEAPPPPVNPAALAAVAEDVGVRMPIPVPAAPIGSAASEQVDDFSHSAAPAPVPELVNTAIQAELAALKLQYQEALKLLAQKDAEISNKDTLLQEKETALGNCHAQLERSQESLAKAEKKVANFEAKHALFFRMSSAMLEQSKQLAEVLDADTQLGL